MTEDRSKWLTQTVGSVLIQLIVAAIIGTVVMYGVTERLTERMDHVETEVARMSAALTSVQIELAKRDNRN